MNRDFVIHMYNKMHLDTLDILADHLTYKTIMRFIKIRYISYLLSAYCRKKVSNNIEISYNNGNNLVLVNKKYRLNYNRCDYEIFNNRVNICIYRGEYKINMYYCNQGIELIINSNNSGYSYNMSSDYYIKFYDECIIRIYLNYSILKKSQLLEKCEYNKEYFNRNIANIRELVHNRLSMI